MSIHTYRILLPIKALLHQNVKRICQNSFIIFQCKGLLKIIDFGGHIELICQFQCDAWNILCVCDTTITQQRHNNNYEQKLTPNYQFNHRFLPPHVNCFVSFLSTKFFRVNSVRSLNYHSNILFTLCCFFSNHFLFFQSFSFTWYFVFRHSCDHFVNITSIQRR